MPEITDKPVTIADYKGDVHPDWCPGCGDFGVLSVLQRALAEMGIPANEVMIVSGIGCSSNLPGFINTYGLHTLHGRSLPIAQGFKLANHAMNVVACGGDGDGYGIGVGHFIHAMRRNIDMTYVVMNNSIYGLTTGQTSPTSGLNMKTKSTPFGNPEQPLNPIALALSAGCSFVARGFSGNPKQLVEIYKAAIKHKGFAYIDTFSPCVTFNKVNTAQFYRDNTYEIEGENHDKTSKAAALERALETDRIGTGIFYVQERPQYEEFEKEVLEQPLVQHELGLSKDLQHKLIEQFV
ncbi:MAG: 2-oxoacid:ferredoxin oxidoreductase subunit beta [Candidatus Melainabacteria bacterium]|nr:2-oxoacid:ferredoxin oxidoreductase subunit beta [Candidatus Melainabacteria bacterium]